jgi:hypothetical protein
MIVYVDVSANAPSSGVFAYVNPAPQFLRAVHNHPVPYFGLLLDTLAVAKQPNVSEIGGDGVKLLRLPQTIASLLRKAFAYAHLSECLSRMRYTNPCIVAWTKI